MKGSNERVGKSALLMHTFLDSCIKILNFNNTVNTLIIKSVTATCLQKIINCYAQNVFGISTILIARQYVFKSAGQKLNQLHIQDINNKTYSRIHVVA